jgi:hypothetical protein
MTTEGEVIPPTLCAGPLSCRRTGMLASLFVSFSLVDLYLTWYLLATPGEVFYEANPVALFMLESYGWWGMVVYKVGCVALVLGACLLVARWRPRTARRVLAVGCPALIGVVGYSLGLVVVSHTNAETRAVIAAAELRQRIDAGFHDQMLYQAAADHLAEELAAGRVGLAEAVSLLHEQLESGRHDPLPLLRDLFGRHLSNSALLAAHLVRKTGFASEEEGADERAELLARLSADFTANHGLPLPEFAREPFLQPPLRVL